jgi:hypothetical protein
MVRIYDHAALYAEAWTEPTGATDAADDEGVDLDSMTKAELRAFADENGVDLDGVADRKDDLVEAIAGALGDQPEE